MLKQQEKTFPHVQDNPYKVISRYPSRNFAGQDRLEWYIQSAGEKTANQEYFSQQSCPSEMKELDSPRKTKAEVVHHC